MKTITISGVIGWDVTAQSIREALSAANGEDVTFVISSPGGFISVGLEIFNLIRNYPGHTTALLSGFAMSMASYLPFACDRRVAEDNAVYMIHNARGGVWGDHNEILGYGAFTKGLSGLLSKQYAKSTGKPLAEITEMMDKETFFFGDEILAHGFVDEIIATEEEKDGETALASAQAIYKDAYAKWSADTPEARSDMTRAMAFMPLVLPAPVAQQSSPPAVAAGTINQEVQQMSLKALLAANPAAQAEFDTAMNNARNDGITAGKAELQGTIAAAAPFLSNPSYPKQVGEIALKVITGELQTASLTSIVATADMVKEMQAGTQAAAAPAATVVPTPAATLTADATNVCDDASLQAAIAAAKGEV